MSTDSPPARSALVAVIGVSASGKTTVGEKLAAQCGVEYADADTSHPTANIEKMSSGVPLTDEDRWPWLRAIGAWLASRERIGGVVSCSALRRVYRDALVDAAPSLRFLHLDGDPEVLRQRIAHRNDHFMPPALIDSQLATLEPLEPDERGVVLDLEASPDEIVTRFLQT